MSDQKARHMTGLSFVGVQSDQLWSRTRRVAYLPIRAHNGGAAVASLRDVVHPILAGAELDFSRDRIGQLDQLNAVAVGDDAPVEQHGERRSYTLLHDAGGRGASIQQNLGHANLETALGYVGELKISPCKLLG